MQSMSKPQQHSSYTAQKKKKKKYSNYGKAVEYMEEYIPDRMTTY